MARITGLPAPWAAERAAAPGLVIERAPEVLWVWLRGDERGEIVLRSQRLVRVLAPAFRLKESWDAFKYAEGRDLSGYVDGTENPTGDEAIHTAMIGAEHPTIRGSSFVATQRWRHDFERLESMTEGEKDSSIGRRLVDNEEIDDAPETAHVKRTAQESFTPEAFVLRRSMPWAEGNAGGLMFVATINRTLKAHALAIFASERNCSAWLEPKTELSMRCSNLPNQSRAHISGVRRSRTANSIFRRWRADLDQPCSQAAASRA